MQEENILELAQQDYEKFYSRLITIYKKDSHHEGKCMCPVHGDSKASLSINLDNGKWHCFGCDKGGNTPISFYQFLYECDDQDAQEELKVICGLDVSPVDDYKLAHRVLLGDSEAIKYLNDRGITNDTIKAYQIGWDKKRYWIPIFDWGKNLRNVRKHLRGSSETEVKDISSFGGTGAIRLYPIDNLRSNIIYIFEGELDCLLAITLGLNAITVTGGAGSWNLKFNKYFAEKTVYVCYDIDKPGHDGARKIAQHILDYAKIVYTIDLPTAGLPSNGDFTDFIKLKGYQEFLKIPPQKFEGLEDSEAERLLHDIHLSESTHSMYFNKRIRSTALITGKGELFQVPKKVSIVCKMDQEKQCVYCENVKFSGKRLLTIKPDNPLNLKFIRVGEQEKRDVIKEIAKIPAKCNQHKQVVLGATNIEECVLIPEIDYSVLKSMTYVSRFAYIAGDYYNETNKPYLIESIALPHPRSQKATLLTYHTEATKDNIDSFELTPSLHDRLKIFQADSLESCKKKLEEKYVDYEAVTGIFKRHDLFLGVDLTFHSMLSFEFQYRLVKRGYVISLVFGDTRTGKSETIDNLMGHFRAGETVGGENVSFAGLVGGVHQLQEGGKWAITWKVIPLNDRRLVKIDEFHEMHEDDVRKMSELMSTGIASIQKIHSEKTLARTRLIMVANSKGGRNLSDFQYGCLALPSIMGNKNEDIARLDFAIATTSDDVSTEEISDYKKTKKEVKKFTSDLCHDLVMWCWSRRPQDIVFEPVAESLISKYASEQVKRYHASIPLVPPAEHSVKLARLAVAAAGTFYSTTDGKNVIVKEYHVELVKEFLDRIYSSKAMKFEAYSTQRNNKDNLKDVEELKCLSFTTTTKETLLSLDVFNISTIEQVFNVDKHDAKLKVFVMMKNNAVQPYGTNLYRKTPAFIKFLTDLETLDNFDTSRGI